MSITETKPQHPIIAFKEQLDVREGEFKAALPAHIPVARFNRIVMTAVQNNLKLLDADRRSFWNSAMKCAQDGLLPDGREAAFVLFQNNVKSKDERGRDVWEKIQSVQYMPMIAGVRKKVRNSGEITSWESQVVYAKDHFEFELGDDPFIKHKPFMGGEPGPVIAAYSVAVLKTGEKSREVMTRAQLDKVRDISKSKDSGPWVTWFDEMCRKTVARRHSKVLPMNTDLDDLIRRDDSLYDLTGNENTAVPIRAPRTLASRLDAIAANDSPHDPETGEIDQGSISNSEHAWQQANDPTGVSQHEGAEKPATAALQHEPKDGGVSSLSPPSGHEISDNNSGINILNSAREHAMEGRKSFDNWYQSLGEVDRNGLKTHMPAILAAAKLADIKS